MAHQTPHPLTRCCDAQTKVLSADTEILEDMARQKPLMQLEEKMVSLYVVVLHMHASFILKGSISYIAVAAVTKIQSSAEHCVFSGT